MQPLTFKHPSPLAFYSLGIAKREGQKMSILFVIIAIVAIVLAITGGIIHALGFLLWVGIVLLILAVIAFLIRSISGRRV
jgi:cytochrome b subunit of formate dehydrogenase